MKHRIVWKNGESGELIADLAFQSEKEFRIIYLNEEHKPQMIGKAPLKHIRRPFRTLMRKWVDQHIGEIKAFLRGHIGADGIETIAALPTDVGSEIKLQCEREFAKRDAAFLSYIIFQAILAVMEKLRKEPEIKWEADWLANGAAIYRIILQGGEDETSIHNTPG